MFSLPTTSVTEKGMTLTRFIMKDAFSKPNRCAQLQYVRSYIGMAPRRIVEQLQRGIQGVEYFCVPVRVLVAYEAINK